MYFTIGGHSCLISDAYYRLFDSDKGKDIDFILTTGKVIDSASDDIFIVSIVTNNIPTQIEVR